MPIAVPRSLVEFILLGPEDDRRQLQDSPILGDVWVEFATRPGDRIELLITPYKEQAAGRVATTLSKRIAEFHSQSANGEAKPKSGSREQKRGADIAYLQGIVAARLTVTEVLKFVVPMTHWWMDKRMPETVSKYFSTPGSFAEELKGILTDAGKKPGENRNTAIQDLEAHKRYMALAALILWAEGQNPLEQTPSSMPPPVPLQRFLHDKVPEQAAEKLKHLFQNSAPLEDKSLVYQISLNRTATPALVKSVPAVKADAARTLFTVDCSDIVWAVIDSGIHAEHDAFKTADGKTCRIKKSFDFTKIRDIVSLDNLDPGTAQDRIETLLRADLQNPPTAAQAREGLKKLAQEASEGRPIDWTLVERLIEIKPATKPPTNHGTHVAGILAANKKASAREGDEAGDRADGMCPDIWLYDFRVLAPSLTETEFAICAALQYIRYLNERNSYMTIHGANLSLSIRHDVRNYACGRTPICDECERLINSGVVVVAAAGNRGYQNFETAEGLYEGYAAFSVTDPGNADGVITVGATHRFWPHTYGVSFFSSRGPTGDGRLKPDVVAPGERIRAPLRDNEWGELDGTSMAAPHVSGAAAMLMARYSELVGQPRRIKEIICKSATDLGRERSFQGHGMLDVLRAFQSI